VDQDQTLIALIALIAPIAQKPSTKPSGLAN